ncbi:MAG: HAMP domain-containing protein [Epsilonproteobacteria bacterium]|nr:HAMP domain-containing protein [Campylobacterota bacterium]
MNNKENLKSIVLWWLGTFVALLLIIFNTIFYELLKHSFYNRVYNSLLIIANDVKDKVVFSQKHVLIIPQKLSYPISPVMIGVFSASNMKLLAKTVTFLDINLYPYLKSNENFFIIKSKKYDKLAIYIVKIQSPIQAYIVVATPMYKIDMRLQDILIKMLLLNPILLLLLLIGANVIIDRILNPIKEIVKVASKVNVGELDVTIPLPPQKDEIYELVLAFNTMIARLKDGIEMIEQFNSDVSHELKTPLTVLKGELEIALRKPRNEEYYKKTIQIALKEVNYLIELVEQMLFFTKLEDEANKKEYVYLDDILLDVLDKLSIKAQNKHINIVKIENIQLYINPVLLKTIFINIIDNAIKYTPDGKSIYIYLYRDGDKVVFKVVDEGIGIDKEELHKITTRFYRSEQSRSRQIKGFGLGLSIVKKALDILGADIEFHSDKLTEVKVLFRFTRDKL